MSVVVLFGACSGSSSDNSNGTVTGSTNSAPVVDAGSDAAADEATPVQLAATVSDADGDTLTYTWSQTSGTDGSFSNTSVEDPEFTTPNLNSDEDVVLQLIVSDGTATTTDTVTISVSNADGSVAQNVDGWLINTSERATFIAESSGSSQGALYDVQSALEVTVSGVDYVEVQTQGIPKYDVEITQDVLDELNNRPRLTNDFSSGVTTATLGDIVAFGEDIGYNSNTENCNDTGGFGYWPPGPVCPLKQERTAYFPAEPEASTEACETAINTIGLFVNGTAIFGWGDTFSYNNEGVFYNLAAKNEIYDLDICLGHAAMGEYHAHNYTQCIADLVGDDGTEHSPIIGYAADGYPVYGPWESNGVLAVSGWVARDYGASAAAGGCGTPGERTCVLVDEFDISQGVTAASSQGPDIDSNVTSLSGNTLQAVDGFYYEDYYASGAAATSEQLDAHNGHNNSDGRGYHYHVTMIEENGVNVPAFPFTLGPTLYGAVPDNGIAGCDSGTTGGPGGPP
ncbi:MAG: YHYH protein [Henriciella sp.]